MYESIERLQKPVIASVNGFAVGGGNVLQVVCDLTIAKESAVFRQVGPMMGSFDAGYGTWLLEDLVGKKKAKELWFRNPKLSAREALELGLINSVVPDDRLREETRAVALEIADRGPFALASIKAAFNARHGGRAWIRAMVLTAGLFPGFVAAVASVLNTVAIAYHSLAAVPFGTIVLMCAIWAFVSGPLVLLGTVLGRNWAGTPDAPCRVKSIARPIPPRPWYASPLALAAAGGLLPFGSIFIEIFFVFTSFWCAQLR